MRRGLLIAFTQTTTTTTLTVSANAIIGKPVMLTATFAPTLPELWNSRMIGIPDLLLQTSSGYTLYPGQSPSLPDSIFVSPAVANFTSGKPALFSVATPASTTSFQLILNSSSSAPGGCLIEVNPSLRTIRLQRNAAWVGPSRSGRGC